MFTANMPNELMNLVDAARAEVIDNLKRESKIGPTDWHLIDDIIAATFDETVAAYMRQLVKLMQMLADADISVPRSVQLELIKLNIHSVMLTSVLTAHFEVIRETGRVAHDAHLHLDRVKRAAEREQTVAVAAIYGRGSSHE